MKKNLFILAAAALAFTACSSDETIAVNEGLADANTISFRPLMNNVTRATYTAGVKAGTSFSADDQINVWATKGTTPAAFFSNATFTYSTSNGFTSTPVYYWPATVDASTNKLDFYASYGADQTAAGVITGFAPSTSGTHYDLLTANLAVTAKPAAGAAAGALAFKHALSQIEVKVKNTNANLEFVLSGVKIGYVAMDGTCTFTSGSPVWSAVTVPTSASTNIYSQTISDQVVSSSDPAALTGVTNWMIVPQNLTETSGIRAHSKKYSSNAANGSSSADPLLDCAYIAIEMIIRNATDDATIVAKQWCYWPITTNLEVGKKYTYIVDLAGGGYQPCNTKTTTNTDLVPVLDGLGIWFSTASSIEEWVIDLNGDFNTTNDDINIDNTQSGDLS